VVTKTFKYIFRYFDKSFLNFIGDGIVYSVLLLNHFPRKMSVVLHQLCSGMFRLLQLKLQLFEFSFGRTKIHRLTLVIHLFNLVVLKLLCVLF